jgi:hypothetical protein
VGIVYLVLFFVGFFTGITFLVQFVLWLVDACLIPGLVSECNNSPQATIVSTTTTQQPIYKEQHIQPPGSVITTTTTQQSYPNTTVQYQTTEYV